ncbi:MAG TPA: hypothetical protein PLB62_16160, partial [Candidatus Sumerlaeota bacterium]|nr:hypothetical protein [Candidatus Sumerlaeota bacterium]
MIIRFPVRDVKTLALFLSVILSSCFAGADNDLPSAEATPCAVIFTTIADGDPYSTNSLLSIDTRVRENTGGIIQSFSFRVYYNSTFYEFLPPPARLEINASVGSGYITGTPPNVNVSIISQPNTTNVIINPGLCRLKFRVLQPPPTPQTIRITNAPPNYPLVDMLNRPITTVFDYSATDPLRLLTPTPTPT